MQLAGPVFDNESAWLFLGLGVALLAGMVVTIVGIVRAAQNGDTVWLIGMVAAFFFGFGWAVALAYLLLGGRGTWLRRDERVWVADAARFCRECGAAVVPGAKFCTTCGESVPVQMRSLER